MAQVDSDAQPRRLAQDVGGLDAWAGLRAAGLKNLGHGLIGGELVGPVLASAGDGHGFTLPLAGCCRAVAARG